MKVHKVELMIIDFDDIGPDSVKLELENTHYANHCISPTVMKVTTKDIGEWHDDHPLNYRAKQQAEYERLFMSDDSSS